MPGTVFTLDALHCDRQTMALIPALSQGDYLIQVKENSPELLRHLRTALAKQALGDHALTHELSHGRIEHRAITLAPVSPALTGKPHTWTAIRVHRQRQVILQGETVSLAEEDAYYVASFTVTRYSPAEVLALARGHWHIENGLHYRKDRWLDEDRNRASQRGIGEAMSVIRTFCALIYGRSRQSGRVIARRLSQRQPLLSSLLKSPSLRHWEEHSHPYHSPHQAPKAPTNTAMVNKE